MPELLKSKPHKQDQVESIADVINTGYPYYDIWYDRNKNTLNLQHNLFADFERDDTQPVIPDEAVKIWEIIPEYFGFVR